MKAFIRLALALLISGGLLATPPAQSSDLPAHLDGVWRGHGSIRPKNFGKTESVKCRVRGKAIDTRSYSISGRCASARRAGRFVFVISGSKKNDQFTATATFGSGRKKFRFSGRRAVGGFVFTLNKPVRQFRRTITSMIKMTWAKDDTFTLIETVKDIDSEATAEAITLVFSR